MEPEVINLLILYEAQATAFQGGAKKNRSGMALFLSPLPLLPRHPLLFLLCLSLSSSLVEGREKIREENQGYGEREASPLFWIKPKLSCMALQVPPMWPPRLLSARSPASQSHHATSRTAPRHPWPHHQLLSRAIACFPFPAWRLGTFQMSLPPGTFP